MRERWILGGIALVVVAAIGVFTFQRERRADVVAREPEAAISPGPEAIVPSLVVPSEKPADPVEPAVDSTRSPVSTAPEVVAAGRAVLVVRAVLAGTSTPLAGVTIGPFIDTGSFGVVSPEELFERLDKSAAETAKDFSPRDSWVTDSDGTIELSVSAGKALAIQGSSDDPSLAPTRLEVPALAVGERREVTLEIAQSELLFLGRIVERKGEAPVSSARITLFDYQERELSRTESDGSGIFSFRVASFAFLHLRIEAPGFAVAFGDLTEGHELPAREAVFRLDRASVLHGHVSFADGRPAVSSTVRAQCARALLKQPAESSNWGEDNDEPMIRSAVTDDEGTYRLEGLPPSVRLEVNAFVADRSSCSELIAIALAPGEERDLAMVLEPASSVDVLVLDERGAPVAYLDLWLAKESWTSPGSAGPRYFDPDERPERELTTDKAGRCRIDSVAKGSWFLGPAPGGGFFSTEKEDDLDEDLVYPAIGQPIVIGAGAQEITLSVERGASIEGRIVDADGDAMEGTLFLECRSDAYGDLPMFGSHADGTFRTPLLAEGVYRLATPGIGSLRDSVEVTARAGDRDVVLQLVAVETYTVEGRVSGFEDGGETVVQAWNRTLEWFADEDVDEDGEFQFTEMEPGTYVFAAETEDGRFGIVTNVDVHSRIDPLLIAVRPAGRLVVRCPSTSVTGIQVVQGDQVVQVAFAIEGSTPAIVVPPGDLDVRLFPSISLTDSTWGAPSLSKTVSVQVGSEVEIVFP